MQRLLNNSNKYRRFEIAVTDMYIFCRMKEFIGVRNYMECARGVIQSSNITCLRIFCIIHEGSDD
jgi:hypothetical protein